MTDQNFHIESHGQQGGITAGIVNVVNIMGSSPRITLSDLVYKGIANGHLYQAVLHVDTEYDVPSVRVIARAQSIQSLEVRPRRSGMSLGGHSGRREGFHFTTLQHVAGDYLIQVVTVNTETVTIDLE